MRYEVAGAPGFTKRMRWSTVAEGADAFDSGREDEAMEGRWGGNAGEAKLRFPRRGQFSTN